MNYLENEAIGKKKLYMKIVLCHLKRYMRGNFLKSGKEEKKTTISSICCWVKFQNYKFTKGENKFKTFVTSPELTLSYHTHTHLKLMKEIFMSHNYSMALHKR